MPLTSFEQHHLAVDLEGDALILRQIDHSGNESTVVLHASQVRSLAEEAGLLAPARPSGQQERALLRLWHKLDTMAAPCWLDEIVDRVGDGLAYRVYVHDALDTIECLMEDLGIAIPASVNDGTLEEPSNGKSPPPPRHDKSDEAISVTPKRGRPATGQALSPAERQARHRARQAELLPADDDGVATGGGANLCRPAGW
ncbi:MAG: hypothetical protein KJZ92_04870 [Rhodocyclaceae bacterium]|nr:hypothetical protein [Rhodocyclaceae bacterium]